jgi:hypothetical protein
MSPPIRSILPSTPQVSVKSVYTINRYGYGILSEQVTYHNNGTAAAVAPDIQFGLGNVTSMVTKYDVTGSGYSATAGVKGNQSVFVIGSGGQSISSGGSSSFTFRALIPNIASEKNQTTLKVLLVTQPFVSLSLKTLKLVIRMPGSTQFAKNPSGYTQFYGGVNVTYYRTWTYTSKNSTIPRALTQVSLIKTYSGQDFHPLAVYSAKRTIMVSGNGNPVVQDSLTFKNLGTTQLSNLTVSALTSANSVVTVIPSAQPPLLSPSSVTMHYFGISLADTSIGLPVDPGQNYTITYYYPLAKQFYNVTGGVVSMKIPMAPPIDSFVDSYTISMSVPPGVTVVQNAPQSIGSVDPFESGQFKPSYALSVGWALDGGVPAVSILFVVSLIGLFAARTRTEEEEGPEETATERASAMIKAFEEKTSLINSLFEEIPTVDPNQLNKAYFDELRARLDTFRTRALQRLNEVKQKSTTKKFFDLLSQMHDTEREVERSAKDMLNLYEQYYTRRMRKEVFDRLLPNYRRRLDKALNQLSDELNTAQREAKLL